ncbi:MAG: phosphoribosylamine--glycine ligase, partial [Verrucomicrobiales bacterium VVV1]
ASRRLIEEKLLARIEQEIVQPTVDGLRADGLPYRGFLYFGLMLTADGPKVIEYNCRFGDPECQAVMPLVKGDLAAFCLAGAKGDLQENLIRFDEGWSVCVTLASAGYPESSRSGDVISGLNDLLDARVYHAGTKHGPDGLWVTNGGRVLSIVSTGGSREMAVTNAHRAASQVRFDGLQRRHDIGILNF